MLFEIELPDAAYKRLGARPSAFIYDKNERNFRAGDKIIFRNKETKETTQMEVAAISQNDKGPPDPLPIAQFGRYCRVSVKPSPPGPKSHPKRPS